MVKNTFVKFLMLFYYAGHVFALALISVALFLYALISACIDNFITKKAANEVNFGANSITESKESFSIMPGFRTA